MTMPIQPQDIYQMLQRSKLKKEIRKALNQMEYRIGTDSGHLWELAEELHKHPGYYSTLYYKVLEESFDQDQIDKLTK